MQFIIIAYDGTDEGALERRMAVRPRHLEGMAVLKAEGHVISAGGLLDDKGQMKGSYLIMDFESREQLDEYLKMEPYATSGVWQQITVETCNVVIR